VATDTTDANGYYSFGDLDANLVYKIVPENVDYTFIPEYLEAYSMYLHSSPQSYDFIAAKEMICGDGYVDNNEDCEETVGTYGDWYCDSQCACTNEFIGGCEAIGQQYRDTKCIDDKEQCLDDSWLNYYYCVSTSAWDWDTPVCVYFYETNNSWCEEQEAICKDAGAGEVIEECMQYCP
jgi:hypothetical protein